MVESNNNDNNIYKDNTSLNFKDHNDFFEKFYEIRWDFINSIVKTRDTVSNRFDIKQLEYTLDTLDALILWSSSQLKRGGADFNIINDNQKNILNFIRQKQYLKAVEEIKELFNYITDIHEKTELIPRINVNEEENSKFWRDEENKALKEIKKAFYDVLLVE